MSRPHMPVRRFIVTASALGSLGAGACSWNVGYLDSGDDPSIVPVSEASVGEAGARDSSTSRDASNPASDGPGDGNPSFGDDAGNLIQNPSCEDGITPWSTLGGTPLASSTTFVYPGDTASCYSFDRVHQEQSGDLSSYDGPMQDITAAVAAGHNYVASAWALWAPGRAASDAAADATGGAFIADGSSHDGSAAGASTGGGAVADSGTSDEDAADADVEQDVYITVKEMCGSTTSYVRIASADDVPEATWTLVSGAAMELTVPTGCVPLDLELYVEGPDVGLDLYVDDVTLTLVN